MFTCLDAKTGRKISDIPIDIVVGPPPVGKVETVNPSTRLKMREALDADARDSIDKWRAVFGDDFGEAKTAESLLASAHAETFEKSVAPGEQLLDRVG